MKNIVSPGHTQQLLCQLLRTLPSRTFLAHLLFWKKVSLPADISRRPESPLTTPTCSQKT